MDRFEQELARGSLATRQLDSSLTLLSLGSLDYAAFDRFRRRVGKVLT
jgi:hypothetical protein